MLVEGLAWPSRNALDVSSGWCVMVISEFCLVRFCGSYICCRTLYLVN